MTNIDIEHYKDILMKIYDDNSQFGRLDTIVHYTLVPFTLTIFVLGFKEILNNQFWYLIPSLFGLSSFNASWVLGSFFHQQHRHLFNEVISFELDYIIQNNTLSNEFSIQKIRHKIGKSQVISIDLGFMYGSFIAGVLISYFCYFWIDTTYIIFIISTLYVVFVSFSFFIGYIIKSRNLTKIHNDLMKPYEHQDSHVIGIF